MKIVAGITDPGYNAFATSTVESCEVSSASLLCGAFAEKLGDIEIHEIGVVETNRLDRALDLVAFVTVRGDNVQDFAGDTVLVGARVAAERMPHLLPNLALNRLA